MTDSNDVTRRHLLRASAATAAAVGGIGTAAGRKPASDIKEADDVRESAEQIPCLEVTDRTTSIQSGVPEQASGIRPGSQMFITYPDGSYFGCTANFVWQDGAGDLYIGAAGHCFLPDGANATKSAQRSNESDDDVFDASVLSVSVCDSCEIGGYAGLTVRGSTYELGEVVYARKELPDGSTRGNDFGLVRIPSDLESAVDPSMPQFGGPNGVLEGAAPRGTPVNQYGAGVANGEVFATQGSNGVSQGDLGDDGTWYAAIRSLPGDSGSPLQTTEVGTGLQGDLAAGIMTHITGAGVAGTTIGRCKELIATDIGLNISVVTASG